MKAYIKRDKRIIHNTLMIIMIMMIQKESEVQKEVDAGDDPKMNNF